MHLVKAQNQKLHSLGTIVLFKSKGPCSFLGHF